jgi:hypothetical protein
MNHKELIIVASKWLKNTMHCGVVLTELVTYLGEVPDAIGWVNNRSILVEVKISRSDFISDKKKYARINDKQLGHWRFYLTMPNIVWYVDEIPEGWGLYELHKNQIKFIGGQKYRNAIKPPFESCRDKEVTLLVSALRRVNLNTF